MHVCVDVGKYQSCMVSKYARMHVCVDGASDVGGVDDLNYGANACMYRSTAARIVSRARVNESYCCRNALAVPLYQYDACGNNRPF